MRGRSSPPNRSQTKLQRWYERGNGADLAHERALLAEVYPELSFCIDEETKMARLEGSLTIVAGCGVPVEIELRVEFPRNYPYTEPRVYEVGGRFPRIADRHLLPDGRCCLWLPPESLWDSADPNRLRSFLDQAALFFERQLIYDVTGVWPGPERAHGTAGYIEFIREQLGGDAALVKTLAPVLVRMHIGRNALCPCGSGVKFKRCHLDRVARVRKMVGLDTVRRAFEDRLR